MSRLLSLLVVATVSVACWSGSSAAESQTITPEGRKAIATDAVVASDGILHAIWVEKVSVPKIDRSGHAHNSADELHHVTFDPTSGKVLASTRVNHVAGEVWAFSRAKPVLRIDSKDTLHVMYTANAVDEDGRSAVVARYTRSQDAGHSWEPAKTLNRTAENDLRGVIHGGFAAAHTFGTLEVDKKDRVHAFWIDTRHMSDEELDGSLYSSTSTDGGETFAADRAVFRDDTCPCCQLTATQMGEGVLLGSRQVFAGNHRDPTISIARDGQHFLPRQKLGAGSWQLDGCPLKPVALGVHKNHVAAAYFTLGEATPGVYTVSSIDGGISYSDAQLLHPQAKGSDMPALGVTNNGRWLAVWQGDTDGKKSLFTAQSDDGGRSWASAQPLSTSASGTPVYPVVATGAGSVAYVLWLAGGQVHITGFDLTADEPSA